MSPLAVDELTWLRSLAIKKIVSVKQLKQALTNDVLLITTDQKQQFIFKRLNLKARSFEDRRQELVVQKKVSGYGLAPKVLADCGKFRLQEYVKGKTLQNRRVTPLNIELLAEQLQIIHQLPIYDAQPQRLAFELQLLKKQLNSPVDEAQFKYFLELAMQLDKNSPRNVLCHGDLSLNNIVRSENGPIKILDWEYAVQACAAYDIAVCCSINHFNVKQQTQLTNHYHLLYQQQISISLAQLQNDTALYLDVFTYLNALWKVCFSD